jgi:hypothetical protein
VGKMIVSWWCPRSIWDMPSCPLHRGECPRAARRRMIPVWPGL